MLGTIEQIRGTKEDIIIELLMVRQLVSKV